MKKLLVIALAAVVAYAGLTLYRHDPARDSTVGQYATADDTDAEFARAFESGSNGLQLQGRGTIVRLLDDDNDGSRHQRFIVKLKSGQTLLIAHNIDVAPRISSIQKGDAIAFHGVFEWNHKGGVIHWTHHDPAGRHTAGWVRHDGQTYQ